MILFVQVQKASRNWSTWNVTNMNYILNVYIRTTQKDDTSNFQ